MSQEAEYYLRNITRGEAQELARRIASQERAAAERHAHSVIEREVQRSQKLMRGEITGLRHEIEKRQTQIQRQLDCNRLLYEGLQARIASQDDLLEEHQRALEVLAEHDRELQRQIAENQRYAKELAIRQAATERRLQEEIDTRRAERERNARSVDYQRRSASNVLGALPMQRLEAVALGSDVRTLQSSLQRALAIGSEQGNEQSTLALLLEIQNKADGLLVELDRRETEVGIRRESAQIALESAHRRLDQLRQDKDVATIFAQPLAATAARIDELSAALAELQGQRNTEFSRTVAAWDDLLRNCHVAEGELQGLWNDRDRVLEQVRQRNRTIQAVIRSLIDVWGSSFELDHMYARTDDPRSTLMLQSKRPFGRNVTVHLDLDGRMQVSFTGYVGMECAKDLAEFQSKLEKAGDLHVERGTVENHPDMPNPPGVDGGGGPLVFRPPTLARGDQKKDRSR